MERFQGNDFFPWPLVSEGLLLPVVYFYMTSLFLFRITFVLLKRWKHKKKRITSLLWTPFSNPRLRKQMTIKMWLSKMKGEQGKIKTPWGCDKMKNLNDITCSSVKCKWQKWPTKMTDQQEWQKMTRVTQHVQTCLIQSN